MISWIISRSPAKGLLGWHVQARTEDQLSSFTVIAADGAAIMRGKTSDGKADCFTITDPSTMATMNVVGKIRYTGEWPKI